MKHRGYLYVGFATTLNIILNGLTLGRFLWLEGRVRGGTFRNWCRRFFYRPGRFALPTTEEEIIELVKNSDGIRLFGAGHSFNDGVVADYTLVSLDNYSGVIRKDLAKKQMAFKSGTRVRDCIKFLLEEGLAFSSLPSHNAQSIGGILSTDVHGTGRDWGFVSQLVVSIRVIDGKGDVHDCLPEDDLFKAAMGGIGGVGIISEVVVQAVERFNVEQKFVMSDTDFVWNNLDQLLMDNEHLSLYLFPFTKKCQVSMWNRTNKQQSAFGPLREFLSISMDALLSAWFGGLMAYTGVLKKLSNFAYAFKRGTDLVLESDEAYSRTIYHLHEELEFTVPFEQTVEMCRRFVGLYEQMYSSALPYALFEIRFTPAGHERTLIGAGRERRSTWIDLVINDSHGFEKYYDAAEDLIKQVGARPHLGKHCRSLHKEDMERLHGDHFKRYIELVDQHDPQNKFANVFTRRLFR